MVKWTIICETKSLIFLKKGLLTQSCLSRGFSTIISNLVTSYSAPHDPPIDSLSEYKIGLGHEIYVLNNMTAFIGMTFSQAANVKQNNIL